MSWLFQEMRNYLIKKKDIPMNGEKHTALLGLVESFTITDAKQLSQCFTRSNRVILP